MNREQTSSLLLFCARPDFSVPDAFEAQTSPQTVGVFMETSVRPKPALSNRNLTAASSETADLHTTVPRFGMTILWGLSKLGHSRSHDRWTRSVFPSTISMR